jgi:hypothetical protein
VALDLEGNAGANLAALSGAVPAALFAALMPPVTDVWVTKPGSVTCRMVREMEWIAGGLSMGFAFIVSAMTGSGVPLFITGCATAAIIGAYEYVLRRDVLDNAG